MADPHSEAKRNASPRPGNQGGGEGGAERHGDESEGLRPSVTAEEVGPSTGSSRLVVPLSSIPRRPHEPLLLGRLAPTGHTMLYGAGGAGKGTVAASYVSRLIDEGRNPAILDFEDHPEEWQDRLEGLGKYLDDINYSRIRGKAIWDIAEDLHREYEELRVDYLVVDSVAMAILGQDPLSSVAPAMYEAALLKVGVRSLSLGHVTKQHDYRYPFGSVFWHNLMRVTWSLEGGTDGKARVLTHRKGNRYEPQGSFGVSLDYVNGVLRGVTETPQSVEERLRAVVEAAGGLISRSEAKDRLPDVSNDAFKQAVSRAKKAGWLTVNGSDPKTQQLGLGLASGDGA